MADDLQAGALVPDALVNRMVAERIEQPDCEPGFILDGLSADGEPGGDPDGAAEVAGDCGRGGAPESRLQCYYCPLAGRRQCPVCGALYSLSSNAPTVSEVCDYDGSKLVVRDDDRAEVVTSGLTAYERQTAPVLEYFRASKFDVWEVDGAGSGGPQAIARLIQGMLKDKGYRN